MMREKRILPHGDINAVISNRAAGIVDKAAFLTRTAHQHTNDNDSTYTFETALCEEHDRQKLEMSSHPQEEILAPRIKNESFPLVKLFLDRKASTGSCLL
jgi:hypothetical protein